MSIANWVSGMLRKLYRKCRDSNTNFVLSALRYLYYRCFGVRLFAHQGVQIQGVRNIDSSKGVLLVGVDPCGFMMPDDRTFLHIKGILEVDGIYRIGRGCRIDIGERAVVRLQSGYMNANTKLIIQHGMDVGEGSAIGWDCQFIDTDFHHLTYEQKKEQPHTGIRIGKGVWIGCNVTVLKNVSIADGCVVAANSVVVRSVMTKNALIAGNPARVVRENVYWS